VSTPQPQTSILGPQDVRCIVADPPWDTEAGGGKIKRGADRHYPLLSPDEIVEVIQRHCPHWSRVCDSAHLWMWVTNTTVCNGDAHQVAKGLGFEPKTLVTWVKAREDFTPQKGLGFYTFGATEHLMLCVRGETMKPETRPATWFAAPRGEHSRKPEKSYQIIEAATPGARLELFARRPREGWTVWGNEV
jgi:N6-adenosine-specific RNA methylase IME4